MKSEPPIGSDHCELDRIDGRDVLDRWARRWLHHLHTGCKRCWSSLTDLSEPLSRIDEAGIARLIQRVQAQAPQLFAETVQDSVTARRFGDRLARLSPEHQRLVIANSKRLCSPAVCEGLIERSKQTRYTDPLRSLQLAELAAQIARRAPSEGGFVLMARALENVGVACTATNDLAEALRALDEAESLLVDDDSQPAVLANIWSSRAVVCIHLGRFQSARQLLNKASHLYATCGTLRSTVCTKLRLGALYRDRGEPSRALSIQAQALQASKRLDDQVLRLVAYQNLIVSAVAAKDLKAAGRWLEDARPVFKMIAPSMIRLRFDWVAARYECARGCLRDGITQLQEVSDQLREIGLLGDLKTSFLDLARSYLKLGLRSEARPLLCEVVEISTAMGIQHERRQALALLRH